MYNNFYKNKERGVSLIITFFILTIILAVVLSISVLLYGQVKIIRNIGNSIVAFYAADSGVEKALYYDRKMGVAQGIRGICGICDLCLVNGDCNLCSVTGNDCDASSCSDCSISFSSEVNTSVRPYNLDIDVLQQCRRSGGTTNSYGFYEDVSRAIRLDSSLTTVGFPPSISGESCVPQGGGNNGFKIIATVVDQDQGNTNLVVTAAITGLGSELGKNCVPICDDNKGKTNCCAYREITLESGGDGTWSKIWNKNIIGVSYTVVVMVTDEAGNCVSTKIDNCITQ